MSQPGSTTRALEVGLRVCRAEDRESNGSSFWREASVREQATYALWIRECTANQKEQAKR